MSRWIRWILLALVGGISLLSAGRMALHQPIPRLWMPLLTLAAMGFALLHAAQRHGWRAAFHFWVLSFVISLGMETLGVRTGLIFGPYHYTERLGARFLGLVPYQIPIAWFMMMYPAMVIAERAAPWPRSSWRSVWGTAALAGFVMTAWDLVMDPLMVLGQHWTWEIQGPYFGIPLRNFFGWWLTTFLIVGLFLLLQRQASRSPQCDREAVLAYAFIGLGNTLHAAAVGLGGPMLAGLFALLPWVWIGWHGTANASR